jgi:hypothetical protein
MKTLLTELGCGGIEDQALGAPTAFGSRRTRCGGCAVSIVQCGRFATLSHVSILPDLRVE